MSTPTAVSKRSIPKIVSITAITAGLVLSPARADDGSQAPGVVSLPEKSSPGITATSPGPNVGVSVTGSPVVGTNVRAAGGPGSGKQAELSMASSGPSIVITFNGGTNGAGFVTSTDGGLNFSPIASPPAPAGSNPCCDPGVVADLVGRFYFVQLFRDDGANAPAAGNCTNSLHVSTDGGQTFSNIVGSPFSYPPGTTDFPDMPHPGIDRINLVGGQPQLYVFTRHFVNGINCPQTGTGGGVQGEVVCSTDGGANWTAPIVLAPFTDLAHFATGADGGVYLIGNGIGTNANTTSLLLRRSTNDCNSGLSFGAPTVVVDNLTFGPGLGGLGIDREFPQSYVAVDKTDPNIAYVVWSANRDTTQQDRDIFLARCTFVGTAGSCEAPVRVNDNAIADGTAQWFPMMCVDPNNIINVSWYDQRSGETDIYHTEITTDGGALAVGPSFLTSEASFPIVEFGGAPDYGDYMEHNDACDANHFYVAWVSQVSPPHITPASNDPDIFLAVANNLPDVAVNAPLDFGDVCRGDASTATLEVFNTGDAYLTVNNVSRVSGSTDITVDPNPSVPVNISPDAHVDFTVRCEPTSLGVQTATIQVESNDPDQPTIDLTATCNVPPGDVAAVMEASGDFGNIAVGTANVLDLQVLNDGLCTLEVQNLSRTLGSNEFTFAGLANSQSFPLNLAPGSNVDLPIRFEPSSFGVGKSATFQLVTDDPDENPISQVVMGDSQAPEITISGALDFGATCSGDPADRTVEVCNTAGVNNLYVVAALQGADCDNFTIAGNPFPADLSPDFCVPITVSYTPTGVGDHSDCELVITSDDPDEVTTTVAINASTPAPAINVAGDQSFPPTVIQSLGACESSTPFPIENNGLCPLEITEVEIVTNDAHYFLSGAPSVPVSILPGELFGDGDLRAVFAPTLLERAITGTIVVTYRSDPIVGTTATEERELCGEGAHTGARVLVTQGGVPLDSVDSIKLQRINANRNKGKGGLLDTQDVARNLPLQTIPASGVCDAFQFHREYGTVDNPIQLLPGSYQVTVQTRIDGKKQKKTVGFNVDTCGFNPNITVDF